MAPPTKPSAKNQIGLILAEEASLECCLDNSSLTSRDSQWEALSANVGAGNICLLFFFLQRTAISLLVSCPDPLLV